LLLDQNFPQPVFDPAQLDATVTYRHLSDWEPHLARVQTPDWLVYLAAEHSNEFDGVVTRDHAQIAQEEELVAIARTKLSLITWRKPIEDAVTEWGQLLAYMPKVKGRIAASGPAIFILPVPLLTAQNVEQATRLTHQEAARQEKSYPELRAGAIHTMREELLHRGMGHLEHLLE